MASAFKVLVLKFQSHEAVRIIVLLKDVLKFQSYEAVRIIVVLKEKCHSM